MKQNDDFYAIFWAIHILKTLEMQDIKHIASVFAKYSNQSISEEIVDKFRMTGLSKEDFLTSDFLNRYGLKNLLQIVRHGN